MALIVTTIIILIFRISYYTPSYIDKDSWHNSERRSIFVPIDYVYDNGHWRYLEGKNVSFLILYENKLLDDIVFKLLKQTYPNLKIEKDMTCVEVIKEIKKTEIDFKQGGCRKKR